MAIGAVVIGAVVIVWAALAFEEKMVEQWYLWKLESAEEEERELAAEQLGRMRSRRAIPRLVEFLREATKHRGAIWSVAFSPNGTRLVSTARIWDAATGKPFRASTVRLWDLAGEPISGDVRSHYSFKVLVRIGRPAVPALLRLREDTDEGNRSAAAAALNEIDPQEHGDDSALRDTLEVDSVRR